MAGRRPGDPTPTAILETSVEVDYGQLYVSDGGGFVAADDVDFEGWLWERKVSVVHETGLIILTRRHDGPTPITVRVLGRLPASPGPGDHVVEVGIANATGRLMVTGWEQREDDGGAIEVPVGPLRVRIHWLGLREAAERDAAERDAAEPDGAAQQHGTGEAGTPERLRIDVAAGTVAQPVVLRTWHEWSPPAHEATRDGGGRLLTGPAATAHRPTLEPITDIVFWDPYPTIPEGHVSSMWRDPVTGSRWASGRHQGIEMLAELDATEADRLAAEGFPRERVYCRDPDGRIWTSDQVPMSRAPCLNLIRPEHYAMLASLGIVDREVELPPGWRRIVRREAVTGRLLGEAASVEDGSPDLFQRWRDDRPLPTS